MKREKQFLLLTSVLVASLYLINFFKLDENLITIFDEGYYYLTLQKARNSESNVGISQWSYFITSSLPEHILSNVYNLRVVRFSFRILTFVLFAIFACFYVGNRNKLNTWAFILIVSGMAYFSIGDMIITYNYIQDFFILMNVISLLFAYKKRKPILLIVSGFFSFLSIIVIPPSGFLVLISELVLLIILFRKNTLLIVSSFAYFIFGLMLAVIFTHFFVIDLQSIYDNIIVSTKTLIGSNRGYSPVDHIIRLFIYFRDFFIQSTLLLGLFVISYIISRLSKPIVLWIIFSLGIMVFLLYVKKPEFYLSTLWAFPFILYIVEQIAKSKTFFKSLKVNSLDSCVLILFIFLLPLISVIGTNTPYAGKMMVFILPWSILFYQLFMQNNSEVSYKKLIFIVIFIPLIMNAINTNYGKVYNKEFFTNGPVVGMKLNDNQYYYFQRVDNLLTKYNFEKNKDIFFATTFDHMTIVAFEAKAIETFQLPEDFINFKSKENLLCPKFIFMTAYDIEMLSEEFQKLDWGFPASYDVYYIGTPDPEAIWETDRWLYCKKSS